MLNSNAFRPGIGPQQPLRFTALSSITSGSPNCWTSNCPACSKIEGGFKSQSIEIYWSEQRSALGCLSDQRLTEKQHQGNISQHIYRYVSTCVIFSLAARTVQPASPSLFSSSCKTTCDSLPPSVSAPLSTDTKHSTVMYVCGGIFPTSPWYRMFSQCVLLCFLCACSFFKLPLCGFSLHTRLLTHTPFHNVSKNTSVTAHSIILPASTVIKL